MNNTLRIRVMAVLKGKRVPLTARQIARMINERGECVAPSMALLAARRFIEPAGVRRVGNHRARETMWRIKEAAYR